MAVKTKHKKKPGLKEALINVFNELTGIAPHKKERIVTALKSPNIVISNTNEDKQGICALFALCYAATNMNPRDKAFLETFADKHLVEKQEKPSSQPSHTPGSRGR